MRCFHEIYKWMIFEHNQPLENSLALKLLEKSIIYVNAGIEYLNLNATTDHRFASHRYTIHSHIKYAPFSIISFIIQDYL